MPKIQDYAVVNAATGDRLVGQDASDTTESAEGSTKRFDVATLALATPAADLRTHLNVADGAEANPTQVSAGEITAGTETALRSFSPKDVADIASTHGGGGAGTVTSVAVSGSDGIEVDSGSPVTSSGTIALGVNKAAMLTFLNVEDGATADMTGAEIKAAYEAELDTNAFTDAEKTKLAGIADGATAFDGAYSSLSGTPTLGTAAALNVGTGPNNIVQLDGTGALPAVDGSALTGISGSGDVTGPASSVDNHVALFNGTTGKIIKSAGAALSTVATTGAYSDLSGTPTLGSLAALSTVGTAQIDNSAVTLAKMADMATASLLGRNTAGTGAPEVLAAATVRTLLNVADGATANSGDLADRNVASLTLSGAGTPSVNAEFYGQYYRNTSNGDLYWAKAVGSVTPADDWELDAALTATDGDFLRYVSGAWTTPTAAETMEALVGTPTDGDFVRYTTGGGWSTPTAAEVMTALVGSPTEDDLIVYNGGVWTTMGIGAFLDHIGANTITIEVEVASPADGSYTLINRNYELAEVESVDVILKGGTTPASTINFQIADDEDGTNAASITSMNAVSASSSWATGTATGANTMAKTGSTDRALYITLSSTSGTPDKAVFVIRGKRVAT